MAPQIEEMMLRECDASLWLTEGNILLKHAYWEVKQTRELWVLCFLGECLIPTIKHHHWIHHPLALLRFLWQVAIGCKNKIVAAKWDPHYRKQPKDCLNNNFQTTNCINQFPNNICLNNPKVPFSFQTISFQALSEKLRFSHFLVLQENSKTAILWFSEESCFDGRTSSAWDIDFHEAKFNYGEKYIDEMILV